MNQRMLRNSLIYLLIIGVVVVIFFTIFRPYGGSPEPISTVLQWAKEGRVERIEVRGDDLTVITTDQLTHKARKESGSSLLEILQRAGVETGPKGVDVEVKGGSGWGGVFNILISFLPLIFFGALLLFMMRQAQGAGSQSLNFARSRARLFMANRSTVTFGDVAGVEEAKTELQEVVEFLKFPERFAALGARVPRGLLLMGPPGTGKTLLAKAVAGEAGVPFFSISGSEFVEMFVGVGASRVRDLFDQAKRNAPCIVFIDEIDAVGRHRGAGLGGGHDEREQTLNQILVEMDGFDTGTNIIVIAATNRPDILDPALLRPGRFDRRVVLDLPDINGRKAILMVHGRGKPLEDSVGYDDIARQTPGFSGADLANLVNEAAILAARRGKKTIGWLEFAEAIDRIIAGPERKSRVISPKEKEVTAYHEAGHALVAQMLPNADPVQKISIVSRGVMGGYTRMLPQEDRYLWTKTQFKDRLAVAMGGRTAEELIFNEVTTGASNDLEQATSISRQMVTRFGMSEKLGPRTFGRREEMVFLGREIVEQRDYSDSIAQEIDEEVKHLIEEAHAVATQTLVAQKRKLIELARYLILHETIEGEELKKIFASEPPSLEELQKPLPAPIPATVAAKPPPMPSEEQTPELSPSPRKKEPGPAAAPAT